MRTEGRYVSNSFIYPTMSAYVIRAEGMRVLKSFIFEEDCRTRKVRFWVTFESVGEKRPSKKRIKAKSNTYNFLAFQKRI